MVRLNRATMEDKIYACWLGKNIGGTIGGPFEGKKELLDVQLMGRGYAWLDTGTMDSLVEAADFVQMVEKRQGIKISAPEEIAYKNGWISKEKLLESAERYGKSPYGKHLLDVANQRIVVSHDD